MIIFGDIFLSSHSSWLISFWVWMWHCHPLPCCLQPLPPLFFLLSCFFGWMGDPTTSDKLFYLMILWIYKYWEFVTLGPEGPWYVFYAKRHQVYWGLTHGVVLCWYSHTQTHTAHLGASTLTYPYKYIFPPHVMCSQQLALLYWINNSLTSKIYFLQGFFFSKNIHL